MAYSRSRLEPVGSCHQLQLALGQKILEWQRAYGVVSFAHKHLDWVRDYIRRQREHHSMGTVVGRLEWCDEVDGGI